MSTRPVAFGLKRTFPNMQAEPKGWTPRWHFSIRCNGRPGFDGFDLFPFLPRVVTVLTKADSGDHVDKTSAGDESAGSTRLRKPLRTRLAQISTREALRRRPTLGHEKACAKKNAELATLDSLAPLSSPLRPEEEFGAAGVRCPTSGTPSNA
ncbi:unnamed protein product [Durusdinium trenchii]|uniref:Uncharacterized protein n=1 Tax=Durusdinium trenchii TaxID=1381693 RepID=A0ABP0P636_9DINO